MLVNNVIDSFAILLHYFPSKEILKYLFIGDTGVHKYSIKPRQTSMYSLAYIKFATHLSKSCIITGRVKMSGEAHLKCLLRFPYASSLRLALTRCHTSLRESGSRVPALQKPKWN